MSPTRKRYSTEFKQQAVKLVTEQGYSASEAAEHLGIATKSIYDWKAQLEQKQTSPLKPSEKDELKALRKQVKRLEMERDILKKATAFFAREQS